MQPGGGLIFHADLLRFAYPVQVGRQGLVLLPLFKRGTGVYTVSFSGRFSPPTLARSTAPSTVDRIHFGVIYTPFRVFPYR
jgi:hypothetical protein